MALKRIFVRDLAPGVQVQDVFLLAETRLAQSKNGPYWRLNLQDASGQIEAVIWSPKSQAYTNLAPGQYAQVRGQVGSFKDKSQIVIEHLEVLDQEAALLDRSDFVPASATKPADLLAELEGLCADLKHKPWRDFARSVLRDEEVRQRLLAGAGAKTVHHAYVGGLLEHTLAVCRLALSICGLYPVLDRETLLAAAMFHDLGKAWELSSEFEFDYTDEGRLLGHISIGLARLEPFLEKAKGLEPGLALHFKHIVLSHHGQYEYGSPVLPKTAEAYVLHYADNLDAKLNTIERACNELNGSGQRWTPFNRYLDRQIFRPAATPGPADKNEPREPNDPTDGQCLLPLKA